MPLPAEEELASTSADAPDTLVALVGLSMYVPPVEAEVVSCDSAWMKTFLPAIDSGPAVMPSSTEPM
jgi:hypothetical protein